MDKYPAVTPVGYEFDKVLDHSMRTGDCQSTGRANCPGSLLGTIRARDGRKMVQCLPLSDGGQPPRGVVGYAVRPAAQCLHEGVLRAVLGQVDVTREAHRRRQDRGPVASMRLLDATSDVSSVDHARCGCSKSRFGLMSNTGRTSTRPDLQIAAISRACSRSPCVDQVEAPERYLRLDERAVGHDRLVATVVGDGRRREWLQGLTRDDLYTDRRHRLGELVVQLEVGLPLVRRAVYQSSGP